MLCLLLTSAACGGSKTAVAKPTHTPKPLPTPAVLSALFSGTVAAIHHSGSGTSVSVRVTHDGLTRVPITQSTRIVTSDGQAMTWSGMRAGDSVALAKSG